jgi:sulfatase-like protein
MLKDLARALSLANLCFIAAWVGVLDTTYNIPGFDQYLGIIIDVLLLGALFWVAITLARRVRSQLALRIARLVFPLVLLLPLNGVIQILAPDRKALIELAVVVLAIVIITLSDARPWDHLIIRSAATTTAVLFPFFVITMGQAVWSLTKFSDEPKAPPVLARKETDQRVIWLVFDEMDYQIGFAKRPDTLQLPEFDRFQRQSIFASRAYPPGETTGISMPALISGKSVAKTDPVSPSRIMITFTGSQEPVNWGTQPNLFSEAREAGFNTALVGWYIPYCRVIGETLTSCAWQESGPNTLPEGMFAAAESLVETIPLSAIFEVRLGIRQALDRRNHLKVLTTVLESTKKAVVDPDLQLILAHLPVPHPPGIYNRHKDEFQLDAGSSYLDNLHLADRVLGELRRLMEDAGMWKGATVLVTSDHGFRTGTWRGTYAWASEDEETLPGQTDHRVPFMLKLAGQEHSLEYNAEFNTIITHDLLLALLKRELTGVDDVTNWIKAHSQREGEPK